MATNCVRPHVCPRIWAVIFFACVAATTLFFSVAHAQKATRDCQGTIKAWVLSGYYKEGQCHCIGDRPDCEPSSGKSSPGASRTVTPGIKKYNANNAVKMQLMEAAFGALFKDLFAEPDNSEKERREQQRIAAEQAAEQERQKGLNDWRLMQAESQAKTKRDQQAKVDSGNRLLSQMQTIGGGNTTQPFGSGSVKLDLKPISQNPYPSSQYTPMQRMICSAYFSSLAKNTANTDDVRFYADQAERVMSGQPTYVECRMPKTTGAEVSKRMNEIQKTYENMGEVNNRIQDIETRLSETKEKIAAAETKKEEVVATINELENRATGATPEEKNEIDELLRQAQMQSQQLDQQIEQAKQSDSDLQKQREQAEREFDSMKTQLTK